MAVYSDNCYGDDNGGSARMAAPKTIAQEYKLSPNPTDGNLQLWQKLADKEPVRITVYSAIGAIVYTTSRSFVSNATGLNLSILAPGMYHLVLNDHTVNTFSLRFVKR